MAETQSALFVVTLGSYATAVFGRSFYLGWASSHWPRVAGKVRSSTVVVTDIGGGRAGSNLEGAAYVFYAYEVRGRDYFGSRIQFGPNWWWLARREARRYSPGVTVQVSYDPRAPDRAVLRPGVTWSNALTLPLGVGILMSGLSWLIRAMVSG